MKSKKHDNEFEQMVGIIREKGCYILYGAGVVAYSAFIAIRELYGISPCCFVVTNREQNPHSYSGIPVLEIRETDTIFLHLPILVAMPEIYHGQVLEALQGKCTRAVFFMDAHMEYLVMSRYFEKTGKVALLEDLGLSKDGISSDMELFQIAQKNNMEKPEDVVSVYMAKSHKDKKLSKKHAEFPWVIPVQAGRKCTDQIIAPVSDAEGDNISDRNPDYCELTVTYWVWKNRHSRYKGICHYRRKLVMDEQDIRKITANDIDLVLPLPFICHPDARGQYGRYISTRDRLFLEQAIGDISPEDISVLHEIDRQAYYYDFNMLIAKEEIFNDYARWMFSVLFRTEKYCVPDGRIRGDRYAGYLGELLTTIYIFKNRDKYKIVHAERDWMV